MIRIVLGPPAAGKSTYVEEHRKADSVVVDFDALAQALGFAGEHDATGSVWFVTRAARVAAIRAILAGIDSDAWIIATNPTPARLQTYADAGAKFVIVDPGKDECLRRAEEQGRPSDVLAAIEDWYRHPPVPPDPSKRAKAMNGRNIGIEAMADSVFDAMRSYVGREVGAVASSIRPVSGQLEQITLSLGVLQTATEAMRLQLAELGELRTMILARVEKLEAVEPIPGPPGPAGPAGPEGPAGRDGADGQNGETGPAGAPGPQGEQGPEGPAGRDGRDGIDGAKGEDGRPGETGPAGPTGPQGPAGDAGAIGERGPEGPAGVAGRDGRDGLPGPRGEVGPAGEAGPAGPEGPQGEKGMQGRDGISPDGFSVDREGHVLWFRLKAGDSVFNASVNAPTFIDRGVWKAGETYEPGDAVSWGGSLFLCQRETGAKPETNDDWRLGVKRGRDGKDGKDGKPGERGPAGPAGRDLTQLGTDGSKW